jgi:hypothetical protein
MKGIEINTTNHLKNLTSLIHLDLSFTNLIEIEFAINCISIKTFLANNNNIEDFSNLAKLNNLELIDTSFNFKDKTIYDSFSYDLTKLNKIFIDKRQVMMFFNLVNLNFKKKKADIVFLDSINIIIKSEMKFINCSLIIYFIKRNIHFNLYNDIQVNNFF